MRLLLVLVTRVCVLFLIICFCPRIGCMEKIRGLVNSLSSQSFLCLLISLNFYFHIFTSSSSVPKWTK